MVSNTIRIAMLYSVYVRVNCIVVARNTFFVL
jgi:hypothetical protein